jgi:hypothetical protein
LKPGRTRRGLETIYEALRKIGKGRPVKKVK